MRIVTLLLFAGSAQGSPIRIAIDVPREHVSLWRGIRFGLEEAKQTAALLGTILDADANRLLAAVRVGKRPWGVAVSPDGKYVYTASGVSNDVSVIDVVTRRVIATVRAGEGPWGVAVVGR